MPPSSSLTASSTATVDFLQVPGPRRARQRGNDSTATPTNASSPGSVAGSSSAASSAAVSRASSYPSPSPGPASSSAASLASGSRSGSATPQAHASKTSLGRAANATGGTSAGSSRSSLHPSHHRHLASSRQSSQTSMQSAGHGATSGGSGGAHGTHALSRLRNALGINKHATFLVKLTIHELNNIPLVDGDGSGGGGFSVHWKFRGGKGHDELRAKSSRGDLKAAAEQVVASAAVSSAESGQYQGEPAHKHGLGSKHRAARMLQQHSQQAKMLGGVIGVNGNHAAGGGASASAGSPQPRTSLDGSPLRRHFEAEDADEADRDAVGGVPPTLEPGEGAGEAEDEVQEGTQVVFPLKSTPATPTDGSGASTPASMPEPHSPPRVKKDSRSSVGTAMTFATTATTTTASTNNSMLSTSSAGAGRPLTDSPRHQPSIMESPPQEHDADSIVLLPGIPRAASPSSFHAPLPPADHIEGLPRQRSPILTDETASEPDTPPPRPPTPPRMSSLSTEFRRPLKGKGKSRSAEHALHRTDMKTLNAIGVGGDRSDDEESSIEYPAASNMHRQGDTPIRPVRDNRVEWDLPVAQLVKMDVTTKGRAGKRSASGTSSPAPARLPFHDSNLEHEENYTAPGMLGSGPKSESGLKLQVFQYPAGASDETNKKERLSFGIINLDLAEYACDEARMGRGGVTRRYLLKNARTNATVKLTIELEQVSGERVYSTPPLQKGHVVAGLADIGGVEDTPLDHHRTLRRNMSSASSSSLSTRASRSSLRLPALQPNGTSSSLSKPPEAHFVKPTTTLATDARRVNNAYSPVFGLHHQHHHHTRHRSPGKQTASGYLAPEKVIEQIFNPTFSTFTGPFYKPYPRGVTAEDFAQDDDVESTTSVPSPDQAGSTHSLAKNAASDDGQEGMQVSVKKGHRLTDKLRHVMRVS